MLQNILVINCKQLNSLTKKPIALNPKAIKKQKRKYRPF